MSFEGTEFGILSCWIGPSAGDNAQVETEIVFAQDQNAGTESLQKFAKAVLRDQSH